MYKQNAKALEAVVRLWSKGFETADLFSAVKDLRGAVAQLEHQHSFTCACFRCGAPKQPLCAWVGDAAQLFEEISRHEVLHRLRKLITELQNTSNAFGVVTKKSRKLHFWFARKQKSKNQMAFSLASLCVQSMFGRCSQKLEKCDFPLTVQLVDPECASCSATAKSLHVEVEAHSSMS
jgi:hypothetical protein